MIGQTLSHYRITEELGKGGMGAVYRAEDTKLDRTVALKVLPTHSLTSITDREQFYREARASARLNHPHIATVYEVDERVPEDASGEPIGDEVRPFIALEFVDGPTLASRIEEGPLPLDEAARIALQVAEALEAAHELEIVHRDIKSGNVMLTGKGVAKVLDFGLAKTAESTLLKQHSTTLATVAYLSPEQAGGEEADGRTDLWALGVVLYEMIAGQLPFDGDSEEARLSSILNEDPEPLTRIPPALQRIVSKCLRKDPETRYQSAAALVADLKALEGTSGSSETIPAPSPANIVREVRRSWPMVAAVLLLGVLIGAVAGRLMGAGEPPMQQPTYALTLPLSADRQPEAVRLHPDDRHVLVASGDSVDATPQIVVVDLRTRDQRAIEGTRGVRAMEFSPDGEWIVYARDNEILRVPFEGGDSVRLIEAQGVSTVSWGPGQSLLFSASDGAYRLEAGASSPAKLMDEPYAYQAPRWISGTSSILVDRMRGAGVDSTDVLLVDLDSGEQQVLVEGACCGRLAASGHLLYMTGATGQAGMGQAVARVFDVRRKRLEGHAVVVPHVADTRYMDVSPSGLLVRPAHSGRVAGIRTLLEHHLETGEQRPLPLPDQFYDWVRYSPNGQAVLSQVAPLQSPATAFVMDPATASVRRIGTGLAEVFSPTWSPDGTKIVLAAPRRAAVVNGDVYIVEPSGTSEFEPLFVSDPVSFNYVDWSPTGAFVVARGRDQQSLTERIWRIDVATGEARELRADAGLDRYPRVSPDGTLIAYDKQLDGRRSVWVMSADGADRWLVHEDGSFPIWRTDASAILLRRGNRIMEISVDTRSGFAVVGEARERARMTFDFHYDLHPDGRRLLLAAVLPDDSGRSNELEVVTNWFDAMLRLLPPGE